MRTRPGSVWSSCEDKLTLPIIMSMLIIEAFCNGFFAVSSEMNHLLERKCERHKFTYRYPTSIKNPLVGNSTCQRPLTNPQMPTPLCSRTESRAGWLTKCEWLPDWKPGTSSRCEARDHHDMMSFGATCSFSGKIISNSNVLLNCLANVEPIQ